MDDIQVLFKIQNAQAKKKQLERQLKILPQVKELRELRTDIEQSQAKIHKVMSDIEVNKKSLSKEQLVINAIKDKAGVLSDHLYSGEVTNVKEMENAKKNLEAEEQKISKVEEKALQLMEKIYESENTIKAMIKELEAKKAQFRETNKNYVSQKENINNSMQEIDSWLDSAKQGLSQDLLSRFETLCNRYDNGLAVSLLKNAICTGCHMSVSFDLLKRAKNSEGEIVCDNCGRWLIPE